MFPIAIFGSRGFKKKESCDPELWKQAVKVEHMRPQMKTMQDHIQIDITRLLYRMSGKPFLEYRFYAIASAFDYSINTVPIEAGKKMVSPNIKMRVANADRPHIRLVKPNYKI